MHFTYPGFEFIQPWSERGMWLHLCALMLVAFGMFVGRWTRLCAGMFTFGFGYFFLLDQAYYMNHLYLVCLISFLFVFIPTDPKRMGRQWMIDLVRLQVGVVYFFGGVAKINQDWMSGHPMLGWMQARSDWAVVGEWLAWDPTALFLSWGGLIFDLSIVPFLLMKKTRRTAFLCVVLFHILNASLFRIGIFPYLMVALTTVFFSPTWCRLVNAQRLPAGPSRGWLMPFVGVWVFAQLALPLRHHLTEGGVAWNEEGHFFSWRMKTRSKVGRVMFHALDKKEGTHVTFNPKDELTPYQYKKMATRPRMIVHYAHHLQEQLTNRGSGEWAIHADSKAALNGRSIQVLVRAEVDLLTVEDASGVSEWIVPLQQ
jgi:vitamin K-dependent gamma-carboxylase